MNVLALLHLIPLLVSLSIMANPTLERDAMRTQVEGDVRHGLRSYLDKFKAGFLVDVIWAIPSIRDMVVKAIDAAIPAPAPAGAPPS